MTAVSLASLLAAATETHMMYDIGQDGPIEDGLGLKNPVAAQRLAALAPTLAQACIDAETALVTCHRLWDFAPDGSDWEAVAADMAEEIDAALASLRAATGDTT